MYWNLLLKIAFNKVLFAYNGRKEWCFNEGFVDLSTDKCKIVKFQSIQSQRMKYDNDEPMYFIVIEVNQCVHIFMD